MADTKALPSVDDLKERFGEGNIPLQSDFADLIDLANIGRVIYGNGSPGWGLALDDEGKLAIDMSKTFTATWDLSESSGSTQLNADSYSIVDKSQHPKIAYFALNGQGPTEATTTLSGTSTVFYLPATKITSDKKRISTTVQIIADKTIGKGDDPLPLEYVQPSTDKWSIWWRFTLGSVTDDGSSDNSKSYTLVIEPLTIATYLITDFSSTPPQGELQSITTVNFVYNSDMLIIPQGLISMFSGDVIPDGWALCNGSNGTPDLRDRFIVMAGSKYKGKGGGATTTDSTTITGKVTIGSTKLTVAQIPSHSHTAKTVSATTLLATIAGGVVNVALKTADANSGSTGGGEGHTHSATFSSNAHTHTIDVTPPYYALAFIMKL
ncbi:hypothetical protein AAEY27_00465 [Kosakonia sp. BYX6]|uniref:Tail fiber protein n=1 Tax=Kosakonia calanthes TaxID=3139408 RepID=A0ABZ3B4Z2_9ENTR